jgi:glycosyltransferase involved in cell wall biosynthesis
MTIKKTPSVAVFMVIYNHEKYIKTAIESIVCQKTNFPVKLFIGEDCSTDNSRQICLDMKSKYPGKIELLLNETNLGALRNAANVYEACINYGKYTAICEGDDYWTDCTKLQKQVDFLENNDDFNICCHRAKYLNEVKKTFRKPKYYNKTVFDQADIANHNLVQTLTVVFRNSAFRKLPKAYFDSISGDYFINMMLSETGKIKYLRETMAVYRQHSSGAWQSGSMVYGHKNTLSVSNYYLNTNIPQNVKENLKRNIVRNHILLLDAQIKGENLQEAKNELNSVLNSEYDEAWIDELQNLLSPKMSREYKVGVLVLLPLRMYQNLKSKILYKLHKLKYE